MTNTPWESREPEAEILIVAMVIRRSGSRSAPEAVPSPGPEPGEAAQALAETYRKHAAGLAAIEAAYADRGWMAEF